MSRNNVGLLPIAVIFYNTDIFCMFGNGYICEESSQRAVFCFFACESASHQNHGATDASEQGKQNHGATEQGEAEQNRTGGRQNTR